MAADDIEIVTQFPREVVELPNEWITLADGTRLAARIWMPKDAEQDPVPAILEFLPYCKRDGTAERDELTHPYYAGNGYACVRVDMRGSGESDGILEDEYLKQEQDDGLEILEWIAAQPWCTGKTGMIGISWGGFNGLQIAARRPPSLKAIVTIASTDDRYADDIHYMGGVMLNDNMSWGATMFAFNSRPPDPELVGDKWRDLWMQRLEANDPWLIKWLDHQRRDEQWQHGSVCQNYDDIECAVYAVGGWADGYSNAVPRLLANLKAPAKGIVGPWAHKYPHFAAPGPRIGFLQDTLRWWDYWLKDQETGIMDEPAYRVWMSDPVPPQTYYDERPGRWVAEPNWPSDNIKNHTFHLNTGGLAESAGDSTPVAINTPLTMGAGQGEWCGYGLVPDAPVDQRFDDGCAVVFQTEPLDEAIEIMGAPVLNLTVSADKPNAFIAARLSDVAPDGAATRVTYGVLNLTHRDSHEHPEALEPGKTYQVRLQLNDTAQRFEKGHRIRVALSNTMWPLFWPSPEPVTVTLTAGASTLDLPVRPPRDEDASLAPFGPPEAAEPWDLTEVEPDRPYSRRVERDDVTGELVQSVSMGGGMARLNKLGWEFGSSVDHRFSVRDGDPTSARIDIAWTVRFRRPDTGFDVSAKTNSTITCTKDSFIFSADQEAFEGDKRVQAKTWNTEVKRDLN
ncbi:MAG: CocE/NonD family hydrolase [Pseudomonadota bacterium]